MWLLHFNPGISFKSRWLAFALNYYMPIMLRLTRLEQAVALPKLSPPHHPLPHSMIPIIPPSHPCLPEETESQYLGLQEWIPGEKSGCQPQQLHHLHTFWYLEFHHLHFLLFYGTQGSSAQFCSGRGGPVECASLPWSQVEKHHGLEDAVVTAFLFLCLSLVIFFMFFQIN